MAHHNVLTHNGNPSWLVIHNKYLLGIVVEFGVGEADAGAVESNPGAPLHAHHEGAHRKHHTL